jgi:hypothetical protein
VHATEFIIMIIIITTIIGKNSPFCAIALYRRFCQISLELDNLIFTSLDFATIIFFTEQDR